MSNNFARNGVCEECGRIDRVASKREPYCLRCYIGVVCPVPDCLKPKKVKEHYKTGRIRRKGHPRRGKITMRRGMLGDDLEEDGQ